MANIVTITEFKGVGYVAPGTDGMSFKVPAQAPLADGTQVEQNVTISGVSTQSAAFNQYTRLISVTTDTVCRIFVGGANPAATSVSKRFAANQTEYFCVNPGDKLAVISSA